MPSALFPLTLVVVLLLSSIIVADVDQGESHSSKLSPIRIDNSLDIKSSVGSLASLQHLDPGVNQPINEDPDAHNAGDDIAALGGWNHRRRQLRADRKEAAIEV